MHTAHTNVMTTASGSSPLRTLGWAAYLACSWTWCIGMFLPVLLVRDYGIWGFVVFAVPNVIGAAAMGWVLTAESSRRVAARHQAACAVFSLVTIAFQLYFVSGLRAPLVELAGGTIARWRELAVLAALALVSTLGLEKPRAAAAVVWVISAAMLATIAARLGLPSLPISGDRPGADLLYLAPVCAFGFLLCPYLDLTFHRARQAAGASGAAVFSVGFGLFFFAMILGTLSYFGPALGWMVSRSLPERIAAAAIGAHLLLQLTLTCVFHADAFDQAYRRMRSARVWGTAVVVVLVAAGIVAVRADLIPGELSGREIVYRLFLSFYGLLFPAYAWLCMIPLRAEGHTQGPTKQKLAVLAIACLLASPFYWMGFIERESIWLVPGLGLVLLSRLFVRQRLTPGGEPTEPVAFSAPLSPAAESSPASSHSRL